MNRNIIFAAAIATALFAGCGRRNAVPAQEKEHSSAHSHAGHDHTDHEHTDHDHTGHNHSGHDHSGHDHAANNSQFHQDAANSDEIIFTPAQAARTEFEVQRVGHGAFREVIKCSGTVAAASSEITTITAPVSGVVTLAGSHVMASAHVESGQTLFTLSSSGLASGDAIAKSRIAYDLAKADFDRVSALYKDKLVTNREYIAAEAEYLRAKAEYEPLRRSDGTGGTVIGASNAGYLTEVMVSSGDYVEMGQPLAVMARTNRMELKAFVSQRYFDRLQAVDDAAFSIPSSGNYFTVSALNGKLYSVGRMVAQGSTLVPIVFAFDNNGLIPDGSFAEVSLLGRRREGVITIPLAAITEQQGLHYVYIQLDAEGYSRREVKLGADDGRRVEILSGLREGERVVTKGAVNVKMAASSSSIPHGHTH